MDEPIIDLGSGDGLSLEDTAAAVQTMTDAVQQREEARQTPEEPVEEEVEDKELTLGDRVKDVAVSGAVGLRDTAGSLITLPEQAIDFFTVEMDREAKEGGY